MGLGFIFSESLSGTYYLHDDSIRDHAMNISLRIAVDGLRQFARDRLASAEGTIEAEGLADTDLVGTVGMRLFDQKRITYDLSFGRYRLRGQREFFLVDAVDSLTVLGASLYEATSHEADKEVGRAVLRFDARSDLPALLKSFRPRVRGLLSRGR